MTNRRAFLLGLGTALAAPAIVRTDSLMKLWVPPKTSWGTLLNQNGLKLTWLTPEDLAAWRPGSMLIESAVQYSIPFEAYKEFARMTGAELFK